jgi:hypothetical protein
MYTCIHIYLNIYIYKYIFIITYLYTYINVWIYIHIQVLFGEVLSGTPAEKTKKEIILKNESVVEAEFELIRHDNDKNEVNYEYLCTYTYIYDPVRQWSLPLYVYLYAFLDMYVYFDTWG